MGTALLLPWALVLVTQRRIGIGQLDPPRPVVHPHRYSLAQRGTVQAESPVKAPCLEIVARSTIGVAQQIRTVVLDARKRLVVVWCKSFC